MAKLFSIVSRAADQLFNPVGYGSIFGRHNAAADPGRRSVPHRSGRGGWRRCLAGALALAALTTSAHAAGLAIRIEIKHPEQDTATKINHATNEYGCGVAVSKHEILTCYHVIEDTIGRNTTAFIYVTVGGKEIAATYVRGDKTSDLALLTVDVDLDFVEVADAPALASGYRVVGQDQPRARQGQNSVVTSLSLRVKFEGADSGLSGCPVLDSSGKLCGIFRQIYIDKDTMQRSAECASAGEIRKLLEK